MLNANGQGAVSCVYVGVGVGEEKGIWRRHLLLVLHLNFQTTIMSHSIASSLDVYSRY